MIRVMMSVFALSLLVVPRLLPAVEVTGLYEAEVPVTDQRAAARGDAARAALAEVLAKVTGDAGAGGRTPKQPKGKKGGRGVEGEKKTTKKKKANVGLSKKKKIITVVAGGARRPPFQPLQQQAEQWLQRYQYR